MYSRTFKILSESRKEIGFGSEVHLKILDVSKGAGLDGTHATAGTARHAICYMRAARVGASEVQRMMHASARAWIASMINVDLNQRETLELVVGIP